MPNTYEVAKSAFKKSWTGKNGQQVSIWELSLKDGEGYITVEQFGGLQPDVGSKVDGDIQMGQYGATFKPARSANSKGSGGGYGRSPEEQRSIIRQSAQKCAVALLAIEVQAGMSFNGKPYDEILRPRISFFYDDAVAVSK